LSGKHYISYWGELRRKRSRRAFVGEAIGLSGAINPFRGLYKNAREHLKKLPRITLLLTCVLCACSSHQVGNIGATSQETTGYWTLDFFHFYKGKQTHVETLQFVNRRDCFDTLYQMQVDAKKEFLHSGAGICMKRFVEGQKRTQDDVLGYR